MNKKQSLRLVAACYLLVLSAWVGSNIFCFAQDTYRRANGTLQTQECTFESVICTDMEVESPTVATTTGVDPQIILKPLQGAVTEVQLRFTYSRYPGEVNLYYAKNDAPFDNRYKIWGKAQNDGSYLFTLPRGKIDAIRIDPSNLADITMTIENFTLNAPRSFFAYFKLTYEQLFAFLLLPGFAAACLGYGFSVFLNVKQRKSNEEGKKDE
ncbi:MAG: hypothetical protein RR395_02235 [Ruthenibacterium sp.]